MAPKREHPIKKVFAARLSLEAHALITQRADEAGLSKGEWLEKAILADRTRVVARKRPDLAVLLYQVNKAGNNLNQLAHHFNAIARTGESRDSDLKGGLTLLIAIQRALNEALNRAG